MKIIKGKMKAMINGNNEEVYVFRLGEIKLANIYNDRIEIKAQIPAISKTLMSQTKNYKLPIEKTFVKTYILKQSKFRTDLHTYECHINTRLFNSIRNKAPNKIPIILHKKIKLKMSEEQEKEITKQRKEAEEQFKDSKLTGKYLTRKIDDNTFINFADFILNNLEKCKKKHRKNQSKFINIKRWSSSIHKPRKMLYIDMYLQKEQNQKTK